MNIITLWLVLGLAAYTLAITMKVYEIAYKRDLIKDLPSVVSFFKGLAGILLGPFAFLLITYKREKPDNVYNLADYRKVVDDDKDTI